MWKLKGYFLLRDHSIIAHFDCPNIAMDCQNALAEKHKGITFTLIYKQGSISKCTPKEKENAVRE